MTFHSLIDGPDDVLALFGGIVITVALIAVVFLIPDLRDLALGALISIGTLVYNHFFQKANQAQADASDE